MSIRVAKVDGRCGHPADHARLARLLCVERERGHPEPSQAAGRVKDVADGRSERDVHGDRHRGRPGAPQAEHRTAEGADPAHVIAAIATGLLGGAVPFLAFNLAIRRLTVAHAGLILNLIPVLAAGGAVIALGERLHWPEIVGGALVVGAATAAVILDGRSPAGARSSAAIRDDDIARCCVSVAG